MKKVTIGNATLYCGDCFDVLAELDLKADAVISDPPFGITDCDWDNPIPLDTLWEVLMEHLVKSYTDTGNLVLDCFMGSGSTGVACAIHNRRFIGIEQNKEYFDIAVERIQKAYDECKTV